MHGIRDIQASGYPMPLCMSSKRHDRMESQLELLGLLDRAGSACASAHHQQALVLQRMCLWYLPCHQPATKVRQDCRALSFDGSVEQMKDIDWTLYYACNKR